MAARTRSASCPTIAKTSFTGTIFPAARITCSRSGLPTTSCNTLGNCDLSLVPLPAAMIAIAIRGGFNNAAAEPLAGFNLPEDLPFAFFIRPTIPLRCRLGYFLRRPLQSLRGVTIRGAQVLIARVLEETNAKVRHRARHSQRRRCDPGPGDCHLAKILQ